MILDRLDQIKLVINELKATSITAGTPVAVWTPATGKWFRLLGWALSLSVAGSILFEDGSGTEFIRTPLLAAGIGIVAQFPYSGYLSSTQNNKLYLDVTASGAVSGYIYGIEEM
jgi:hypothetical protein